MSNCKDFSGKVVIITGSSSGIGEGVAIYLASLGAQVVITGRDENKIRSVAEKCRQLSQQKVLEVVADLTKYEDIEKLIYETINEFGKLDVLVNNAGILQFSPIESPDLMQIYDKTFDTNVRGVVYLTNLSVPYLEKTKGNIVNVSSVCGLRPSVPLTIFSMAKSALDMFTKCLALELGSKGIRVNNINPASIRTPIFEKLDSEGFPLEEVVRMSAKYYPVGRIGETIDCAKAVAYLASDDASFVSGTLLPLDGGSLFGNMTSPIQ